jgi:hypothetical protein
LSHTPSPCCSGYFGDGVISQGWPQTSVRLLSASQVAWIAVVSHQHLANPLIVRTWENLMWLLKPQGQSLLHLHMHSPALPSSPASKPPMGNQAHSDHRTPAPAPASLWVSFPSVFYMFKSYPMSPAQEVLQWISPIGSPPLGHCQFSSFMSLSAIVTIYNI